MIFMACWGFGLFLAGFVWWLKNSFNLELSAGNIYSPFIMMAGGAILFSAMVAALFS